MSDISPEEHPWFCLRAQPRREGIAAAHLPTLDGVRVFYPRVRYLRKTRRGPVRSVVALFPGYLFAQFDPQLAKQVAYTQGVARIVRRGEELAEVPLAVMTDLFAMAPQGIVGLEEPEFKVGQTIRVIGGVFLGTETKIVRLAPAKQRVAILLEFLGQTQEVEIPLELIDLPDANPRKRVRGQNAE